MDVRTGVRTADCEFVYIKFTVPPSYRVLVVMPLNTPNNYLAFAILGARNSRAHEIYLLLETAAAK